MRSRDAASSTRSIALSGRKRSEMYRSESTRGRQRSVADAHAVVRLVPLLEAAQDRDRVRDGGLADQDRLEAPLERRVLLDVLAVLVEGRRPDSSQLAAGEHRLQHVGRVDGSLGGAGARRSCAARR